MTWESSYLDLLSDVMTQGAAGGSRAGRTRSKFGCSLSIAGLHAKEFPLVTTRKIYYKPVLGELAAFLRGATDNGTFMDMGCNYWTMNARQWKRNAGTEDDRHLELGAIYGRQWVAYGSGMEKFPVDQLAAARELIKIDPESRRILVTAWNPHDLPNSCLPPCHVMFQFHTSYGKLHCSVYMRSVDLCLGLPSDVTLYYALLILMAHDTGFTPGDLHFHFGNAHIYEGHVHNLEKQLTRDSDDPPYYRLFTRPDELLTEKFLPEHLDIVNYQPMEAIAYELY